MGAYTPFVSGGSQIAQRNDVSFGRFYRNAAAAPAKPPASATYRPDAISFEPLFHRWSAPLGWSEIPSNPPAGQERWEVLANANKVNGAWIQPPTIFNVVQDTHTGLGPQYSTDNGATWHDTPQSGINPPGTTHARVWDSATNSYGPAFLVNAPTAVPDSDAPVLIVPQTTIPATVAAGQASTHVIIQTNFVYTAYHTYHWYCQFTPDVGRPKYYNIVHGADMWRPDFQMKHWLLMDEAGASIQRMQNDTRIAGPRAAFRFEQSGADPIRHALTFNLRVGESMSVSLRCEGVPVQ